MCTVIQELEERGFIDALTSDDIREMVKKPLKVYVGFDPTSDSLHLGNLVAIMGLAWFQRFGHTPVSILGGATGMIGDPSGKSSERKLLDKDTLGKNIVGIEKNLAAVLDTTSSTTHPIIVNNLDWLGSYHFIDFLRDIGKHFRMGVMLSRESVKSRLDSDVGMSFTEFSYQLLQAYDFLHLFDTYDVTMQLGGSDQWGNIVSGKELVRKMRGKKVEGVTFPLLMTSDGKKFGKSESGAIWLSANKTSEYDFYQYLVRVPDADVITLMRLLTFMDMNEIREVESAMETSGYVPNTAQKRLAEEVTTIVHGLEGLQKALKVTDSVAPGSHAVLDADVLESAARNMPSIELEEKEVIGRPFIEVIVATGTATSKGEARRLVRNKGAYLNNESVVDENYVIHTEDVIDGRLLLLGAGKKKKMIVRIRRM